MKVSADTIKFRRDRVKAAVEARGRKHDLDLSSIEELLFSVVQQLNDVFSEVVEAVNYNDSRFTVIMGDPGTTAQDYLPYDKDAGWPATTKEYESTWVSFNSSAAEKIWFCYYDPTRGSGNLYEWTEFADPLLPAT